MPSPADTGSTPVPDETTLRTRKRFARRQWARRWLAWRPVVALASVVLLAVLVGWLVLFSSALAVEGVDVEGAEQLAEREVLAAAAVPDGEPLARVDLDAVRARVEALAMVRSADVTRAWPDRIVVAVEEREAVAVVEIGGRLRGMDSDGVVFRDFARAPADLPHVRTSTETRSDALREAALVVGVLPSDVSARVDHVSVDTIDQIELVLRDGRTVVWGSADDSEQKAAVLAGLLRLPGRTYDVSVPSNATVAR